MVDIAGFAPEDAHLTLDVMRAFCARAERRGGDALDVSGRALPAVAQRYVERVVALVGVPVELISIGPGCEETIARRDPFGSG